MQKLIYGSAISKYMPKPKKTNQLYSTLDEVIKLIIKRIVKVSNGRNYCNLNVPKITYC